MQRTLYTQIATRPKTSFGASLSVKVSIILSLIIDRMNVGAFGNVLYAWQKKDKKKKFAIKAMKKNDIISSKHVDHIENEKKILEMISHPFIVSSNT